MLEKISIDRDKEVTSSLITKILRRFEGHNKRELSFLTGYYDGTGQAINARIFDDPTKPNNKIVKNYCASIVDNFQGYICGKPVTYTPATAEPIDILLECFRENDVVNQDSTFLSNALKCGIAYELCYVNENQEKKFKNVDARNVIPVYSNDLDEELLYVLYYFPIYNWEDQTQTRYSINVYDRKHIFHYESDSTFGNIVPTGEIEEHYFNEVPWVVFNLNEDNRSIFERIISLQDAYNKLLSDEVNDYEAFTDAYMVLKGVTADTEDLQNMKENRTILLDEDADVTYLTKNSSDTQIENILENLNRSIHTISNSPDFSSEEFNTGVSSGVALQFKLVGFNNIASNIESQFQKALKRRIDLLNAVFTMIDTQSYEVDIAFTHNLPTAIADTINMVNTLRGFISDETLLAQLPFINDVDAELERIKTSNAALTELYNFNE